MKKKLIQLFTPNTSIFFICLSVFALSALYFDKRLAIFECAVILVFLIFSVIINRRRRDELTQYLESMAYGVDTATKNTLMNFPLPMAMFDVYSGEVTWINDRFMEMTGGERNFFSTLISDAVPGFSSQWLIDGVNECPGVVKIGERKFQVFGNMVRSKKNDEKRQILASTYWLDVTEYVDISEEFDLSRSDISIIVVDNYEELTKNMSETAKSSLLAAIDDTIHAWASDCNGILVKYDRDRYLFVFEERYLDFLIADRFSILESVRAITGADNLSATLSIGIGKEGNSFNENFKFASLAIEMSLSRGGDQAVIKNSMDFEFYGGHSSEVERRTKVRSRVMASALGELLSNATNILVMGHRQADLDSVGAAVGICCMARARGKSAKIVIDREKNLSSKLIERVAKHEEYENVFLSPEDAMYHVTGKTLLVVVDTNRPDQVESIELLNACRNIAVIDHHRRAADYIDNAALNYHEPYSSSASELVTELLQYMLEQSDIMRIEAEALLSGIVLDTKSFAVRTGGRTFEAAAFLRRCGADTIEVKRFMQSDFNDTIYKYSVIQRAKTYRDNIAIAALEETIDRIIASQSADELLNISDIQASFVLYPEGEDIVISARSIGDINVQLVLEKLGGGGNKAAAGARVKNDGLKNTVARLINAIEEYFNEGIPLN